jgi:beta-aspartyl-peptidase (threonine type)
MVSRPPSTLDNIPASRRGFSAALLTRTKNPSLLVQELYARPDLAPHAFLSGSTAEVELGHEKLGTELVNPSYYFTEQRWREHRRGLGLPEEPMPHQLESIEDEILRLDVMPTGTVGAVALDREGCIAALTSTGGKTNKLVGRIGDTPSMGSGFWAEEWKAKRSLFSRIWHRISKKGHLKHSVRAVGTSGTGDGDVSY